MSVVLFIEYIESMIFFFGESSVGLGVICVDLSDLIFIFSFLCDFNPIQKCCENTKTIYIPPPRPAPPLNTNYYLCCSSDWHCLERFFFFFWVLFNLLVVYSGASVCLPPFKPVVWEVLSALKGLWSSFLSQSREALGSSIWALQPATVALFRSRSQTEGLRHQYSVCSHAFVVLRTLPRFLRQWLKFPPEISPSRSSTVLSWPRATSILNLWLSSSLIPVLLVT